jgi:hypothetical protein
MLKIRHVVLALGALMSPLASSAAQVSIGFAIPGVSIGINLPAYPELDVVPGYPVYYAPQLDANYFFYDGLYWVFQDDNWYASSWYNGPWGVVNPDEVPVFILRIPVRYYHRPPAYFRGWGYDAPPRWGDHWGRNWDQRRNGWDRWDRGAAPAPAPLPVYQRQYSGDRYPRQVEQQRELNRQNYRYQPNDPLVRQHYEMRPMQGAPVPVQRGPQGAPQQGNPWLQGTQRNYPQPSVQQGAPQQGNPWLQGPQRYNPPPSVQQGAPQQRNALPDWMQGPQRNTPPPSVQQTAPTAPRAQPPQGGGSVQRSAPTQAPRQQRGTAVQVQGPKAPQGAVQQKQPMPGSQGREERHQGKNATPVPKQGQGQGQDQERGRDHNN